MVALITLGFLTECSLVMMSTLSCDESVILDYEYQSSFSLGDYHTKCSDRHLLEFLVSIHYLRDGGGGGWGWGRVKLAGASNLFLSLEEGRVIFAPQGVGV